MQECVSYRYWAFHLHLIYFVNTNKMFLIKGAVSDTLLMCALEMVFSNLNLKKILCTIGTPPWPGTAKFGHKICSAQILAEMSKPFGFALDFFGFEFWNWIWFCLSNVQRFGFGFV